MKVMNYLGRFSFLVLLFFGLGTFSSLIQSLVVKEVIAVDALSSVEDLCKFFGIGLITYGFFYGLEFLANVVYDVACKRIMFALRDQLTKRVLLSKDMIDQKAMTNFLSQDLEFFYDNHVTQVMRLLKNSLVFVMISLYLLILNQALAMLFIIGSLLRPLPQFLLSQQTDDFGKRQSEERENTMTLIMDNVHGADTIRHNQSFSGTYKILEKQVVTYERCRRSYYYLGNFLFFCNGLTLFLGRVMPVGLYFYYPTFFGNISVSSLVAMFVASSSLANPLQNMMYATFSMQAASSIKRKVGDLLNCPIGEIEELYLPDFKHLSIEKISKSYGDKVLFKEFSYRFEKGKKYLIKGASGSGKTTLLKLINGLSLDSGKCLFINQSGQAFDHYLANIGLVSQSPFLFNGTIAENLSLNQAFPKEALLSALKEVNLLEEFPEGLDFRIDNNGSNVSGGQRVRIELARFLLRQKDVLLLDEVTASLDPQSADYIRQLIFDLPITVIEVAHHIDESITYDATIEL